jgi:hypothetical protein
LGYFGLAWTSTPAGTRARLSFIWFIIFEKIFQFFFPKRAFFKLHPSEAGGDLGVDLWADLGGDLGSILKSI